MSDKQVAVTLASVNGGALDQEFQERLKKVLSSLGDGEKGTITITLEVARIKDTTTMATLKHKIKHTVPDKLKMGIVSYDAEFNAKTEEIPTPKDNVTQLKIATNGDVE